jgi:hypothetical protein
LVRKQDSGGFQGWNKLFNVNNVNENLENDTKSNKKLKKDTKVKEEKEMLKEAPVYAPVKAHVNLKEILIRIPVSDYEYLEKEFHRTGVKPGTNAAKYVRERISEERKKQ